jgi:glucose-6-phosphate 1-dehydrogenase
MMINERIDSLATSINPSNGNTDLSGIMVIFGGTGDLTHRKLMPALYNLVYDKLLPENFAVVSIGRREKTTEQYREDIFNAINQYSRNKIEDQYWEKLREIIYYVQFDFTDMSGYDKLDTVLSKLDEEMNCRGNRIFYLAVAPKYFETIVHGLQVSGLSVDDGRGAWKRLVIEKPFGKDLSTARRLNAKLNEVFTEKSIYRIDHYLGKEMIQNILVLRFCNIIFESLWSHKYIDNIQISLNETNGIGPRGGYYENAGAMRDMVQNHIMQILALVAMEPPVNLDTDSIRTEKVKVIQAVEEFTPEMLRDNVVFGQYGKGYIDGLPVCGYREEGKIPEDSDTETFVALKLHINNFRWARIPFYIRTGKRLVNTTAEIIVQFKSLPNILYFKENFVQEPNILVIKIQPNVGVFFQFNTRDFSSRSNIVPVKMDTSYQSPIQGNTPEAYERLIYDIMRGDTTLFTRWDELEAAWMFADRIIAYREQKKFNFPNYSAGSLGPIKAFELLARDGREWWNL